MKNVSPGVRKIIYIVLVALLIIPLSFLALPEIRKDGRISNTGGVLSVLREKHDLSQVKLSEVDPASETMKLTSLGLRGIASCILWMQAMEHKKTENYDQLATTLNTLTKVQPNFSKVWEFQAHNLAYNVSMEFDDYEYRYHWVKKGIGLLKEGMPFNKTDHRITDALGFFTGNKMGKSDEKDSFRRMFALDTEFHQEMEDRIDPDSYETRGYGHDYDSWLMAYQWYDYSRRMVDEGLVKTKNIRDSFFYSLRPSMRRNQGLSLQREFRPEDGQREVWRIASEEWNDYGNIEMSNSWGISYTMEDLLRTEQQIERLRNEMDELVPGARDKVMAELQANLNLPEDAMAAFKLPVDQRDDYQLQQARLVNDVIIKNNAEMDINISQQAKPDDYPRAREIAAEIEKLKFKAYNIEKDASTINYGFWKAATKAESGDIGVLARQALYDAEQARLSAIYEDEFVRDYPTGETTVLQPGAISLYLDAFARFNEVFETNLDLSVDSGYADELIGFLKNYQKILKLTGRQWPMDFPLQNFIDKRSAMGLNDGFPTSEDLQDEAGTLQNDQSNSSKEEMVGDG